MKKIFLSFSIIFIVLTFAGAGFVLYSGGNANAGFAVIPMIWAIIFLLFIETRKKTVPNKHNQMAIVRRHQIIDSVT